MFAKGLPFEALSRRFRGDPGQYELSDPEGTTSGDPIGMGAGLPDANEGDSEGQYQRLLAGTQQPYRSGWGALPGVATSLVNGMAAGQMRQRLDARNRAESQAWGQIGGFAGGPDWSGVLQTAPVGGRAHQYALDQQARAQAEQIRQQREAEARAYQQPERDLDMEYKRAQIDRMKRETEAGPRQQFTPEEVESQKLAAKEQAEMQTRQRAAIEFQNLLGEVAQLTDDPNFGAATGSWQGSDWYQNNVGNIINSPGYALNQRLKQLTAELQLKAVGALKGTGPITDSEQEILRQSIGNFLRAPNSQAAKDMLRQLYRTKLRANLPQDAEVPAWARDSEQPQQQGAPAAVQQAQKEVYQTFEEAASKLQEGDIITEKATGKQFRMDGGRLVPVVPMSQ